MRTRIPSQHGGKPVVRGPEGRSEVELQPLDPPRQVCAGGRLFHVVVDTEETAKARRRLAFPSRSVGTPRGTMGIPKMDSESGFVQYIEVLSRTSPAEVVIVCLLSLYCVQDTGSLHSSEDPSWPTRAGLADFPSCGHRGSVPLASILSPVRCCSSSSCGAG